MSSITDVVLLRGGPAVPIDAVLLVLALESRGCHLKLDGSILVVGPTALLTDDDRAAIRRFKPSLVEIVDYCDALSRCAPPPCVQENTE